ncbi:hypothetical protein [Natronospora cellulosivora (SeqCode)]
MLVKKNILLILLFIFMLTNISIFGETSDSIWKQVSFMDYSISDKISIEGDWQYISNQDAFRDVEIYAQEKGSYFELIFEGSAIRWYASTGRTRGMANLYLNDKLLAENIDLYSEESKSNVLLYSKENLKEDIYTLKIEVLGEKNDNAVLPFVSIDSFAYIPTLAYMAAEIDKMNLHFSEYTSDLDEEKEEYIFLREKLIEAQEIFKREKVDTEKLYNAYLDSKRKFDDLNILQEGNINYRLVNSENWPEDIYKRIVNAMDEALEIYNKYGNFEKNLTVHYNQQVPTAQANYRGVITFGGSISTRVALHEIAHTLGVGTQARWQPMLSEGRWTGKYANQLIQEFDGEGAIISGDRHHFWPYGLNYNDESSYEDFKRHVKMVQALRKDMGLDY